MGQTLSAIFELTDNYTVKMQKILNSTESAKNKVNQAQTATEKYAKSMQNERDAALSAASGLNSSGRAVDNYTKSTQMAENSTDSLIKKMTGLVSVGAAVRGAWKGTVAAVTTAATQQIHETTFGALLNDKQAGSDLYKYVSEYAKTSALGREDLANATSSFLPYTHDMDQINQLTKMAERLYAKDPNQGADGAVFALKEVLSGDTMSLRNRFNMGGVSGAKIRELNNAGDVEGTIEYLDQILNKYGATQEVVDANYNNLITQTNIFKSNLISAIGEESTPVMQTLAGVVKQLNEDMEAGKFQPFFNLMVGGMQMLGGVISFVAENASWLAPVLGAVVAGLITYKVAMMAAALATAIAGMATAAATMNWVQVGAIIAGVTAGAFALSAAFSDVAKSSGMALSELEDQAGNSLANVPMQAEIVNDDPVKVTGEVEIEQENLKYLLDTAQQKFFAQFSYISKSPQVNIYGQTIEKTVDMDEVVEYTAHALQEQAEIQPEGSY